MHVHFWPGEYVAISGLMVKMKSAKMVKTGESMIFIQDDLGVRFTGLPKAAPDSPLTTIAVECDGESHQDTDHVRKKQTTRGCLTDNSSALLKAHLSDEDRLHFRA